MLKKQFQKKQRFFLFFYYNTEIISYFELVGIFLVKK